MKKFLLLLIAPALLLAGGCDDDDGYSLDKFWISMATVENPDRSNYFFFETDGGERMWTAATYLWGYQPKDGQRIIANYTILSDRPEGSSYDHDVRLNRVYNVLTKQIVEITEENNEELGNDPIRIEDIWVGSNYLNLEFYFPGQHKTHYINLGQDPSKVYDDGKVHLELRHNANGDILSRALWGMASFDLKPLRAEGMESITLVIHSLPSAGGEEETHEVVYKFNTPEVQQERTYSLDEGQMGEIE